MKAVLYINFVLLLAACNESVNKNNSLRIIARANNESIDEQDYLDAFINNGNIKDSLYNARKTIEGWATESLFYQEALTKLNTEEANVAKQVEAYRRELVNYIYSTKIVGANLDTVISESEIEGYYNSHRDNFILKENIVKVNYIKVPVKAPGLDKIKRLLMMGHMADMAQLKVLCAQNAENYFINDSTWLYVDEIKKEIPALKEEPDFNLVMGRVLQFTDDTYYYYLKIKDVKVKNGLSPINFEKQSIRKFIINNRKVQLIMQYKQLLMEKAKANKTFETF